MATASGHTSAIRAKKIIGTSVKDPAGKKLGEIEDIVLDKQSNNIMFAVVSFGGFLGMAEKYHPLPWPSLPTQVAPRLPTSIRACGKNRRPLRNPPIAEPRATLYLTHINW